MALRALARRQQLIGEIARQRLNQKKPLLGGGPTGAGGLGFRGRGGAGGGSVDDVASELPEPSSGSLTDSSKFDSCVRQR